MQRNWRGETGALQHRAVPRTVRTSSKALLHEGCLPAKAHAVQLLWNQETRRQTVEEQHKMM